jgi:hypothetical protein
LQINQDLYGVSDDEDTTRKDYYSNKDDRDIAQLASYLEGQALDDREPIARETKNKPTSPPRVYLLCFALTLSSTLYAEYAAFVLTLQ